VSTHMILNSLLLCVHANSIRQRAKTIATHTNPLHK
jgi:hypothetical protein